MTLTNLERLGFEVHDVEGWREHFQKTCLLWAEDFTPARKKPLPKSVGRARGFGFCISRCFPWHLNAAPPMCSRHWLQNAGQGHPDCRGRGSICIDGRGSLTSSFTIFPNLILRPSRQTVCEWRSVKFSAIRLAGPGGFRFLKVDLDIMMNTHTSGFKLVLALGLALSLAACSKKTIPLALRLAVWVMLAWRRIGACRLCCTGAGFRRRLCRQCGRPGVFRQ